MSLYKEIQISNLVYIIILSYIQKPITSYRNLLHQNIDKINLRNYLKFYSSRYDYRPKTEGMWTNGGNDYCWYARVYHRGTCSNGIRGTSCGCTYYKPISLNGSNMFTIQVQVCKKIIYGDDRLRMYKIRSVYLSLNTITQI